MTQSSLPPFINKSPLILLSLFLIAAPLLASFFIFLLSFYQLSFGIWPQSEVANAATHILSGVISLGLFIMALHHNLAQRIFSHPLVFLPLLIAGLSILLIPFHPIPTLSFLGSVRTGEGAILWFDIAVLSAAALIIWRVPKIKRPLIISAFVGFAICSALTFTHVYYRQPYTPFFYGDYLAFNILSLGCLALALTKNLKNTGRERLFAYLLIYVLCNTLLWLTQNNAMILFGIFTPLLTALVLRFFPAHLQGKFLAASLFIVPLSAIALFTAIPFFSAQGYYTFISTGIFETFASRSYLIQTALSAVISEPERLLTGNGWGTFESNIIQFLPLQWLNIGTEGVTQWDGVSSDHFHTHNMYVETFSALGIIGFAIFTFYIASLYLYARKSCKIAAFVCAAGTAVWASMWFLFPVNLPFLALASGYLGKSRQWSALRLPKAALLIALALIAAAQFITGFMTGLIAYRTGNYQPQKLQIAQGSSPTCSMEYSDFNTGGLHLSRLLNDRVRYLQYAPEDKKLPPENIREHITDINHLHCQAELYIQNHPTSKRLEIAALTTRGEMLLAMDAHLTAEEKIYYYQGWKEELQRWLKGTPARSDLAIAFLLYNIIHAYEDRSEDIIEQIQGNNPDDPIGLWFKGLTMLNDPHAAQRGLKMMRQALDNGIQRFMPVEKELLEMLHNVRSP